MVERKDVSQRPVQRRHSSFNLKKLVGIAIIVALGIAGFLAFKQASRYAKMSLRQLHAYAAKQKGAARFTAIKVLKQRYGKMGSNEKRLKTILSYVTYDGQARKNDKIRALAIRMLVTLKLEDKRHDIPILLKAVDYMLELGSPYQWDGVHGKKFQPTKRLKSNARREPKIVKLAIIETLPQIKPHWFGPLRSRYSVDFLISMLKEEDQELQLAAAKSLRRCTGQKFGNNYDKWYGWWDNTASTYPGFPNRSLLGR